MNELFVLRFLKDFFMSGMMYAALCDLPEQIIFLNSYYQRVCLLIEYLERDI